MRIFTTFLLLTCSFFAFGKPVPADTTFSIGVVGPASICGNDSVNIVSIGCRGNVIWNNGVESPSIRALQSGNYFATCVPTNEISNTITVTIIPKPSPPTITIDLINNQYVLNANDCSGDILWSTSEIAPSIIAKAQGSYIAFCRVGDSPNCISPPSNIFNITAPIPMIDTRKTKLCVGEGTTLISTECLGTILWNNGSTGTSIQVSAVGSYTASCVQFGIQSSPSNTIVVTYLEIEPPIIYSPDNIYCLNPTVTLTTNSCSEGNIIWNNGTTATSITVSVAGTYSAQCQNTCGISTTSNVITVSPNGGSIVVPAAPIISANVISICTGETAILTATGCNDTIVWSNGSNGSSITISQIGSYSAICQNQCSNSESSNIIAIQAGLTPTSPVISTTKWSLCNGETATLTASGCSGSVRWSNGLSTSVITVSQIGTYTAICQNQGHCGNSISSNPIYINTAYPPAAPTITSNKTILCDGESATLVTSGCFGSILWSTGATTTSIQLFSSGTYTAICTNSCGSSPLSNPMVLRTFNAPTTPIATSNKSILCNGEAATLVASGCDGNVVWSNGMTPNSIQISQAGTYTVTCNTICGSAVSTPIIIKASIIPSSPIITAPKNTLCNGENILLSSTGCFGNVVWSNGATGVSTTISKSGTYTALCDNVCGTSANSNSLKINQLNSQCTPISIKKVK